MSQCIRYALIGMLIVPELAALASPADTPATTAASWPGASWDESTPAQEGLDAQAIADLDAEFREGRHGYVDSMLLVRNGRIIFDAHYDHDYKAINAELMTEPSDPYNYYDVAWHPYYQGSDLHTMQSTTKSVTSALVGIAIARGEIPDVQATLGELLPKRNIKDAQIAAITLDNILTMQPGFEWLEEQVPYSDPRNDGSRVELEDDWVAYLLTKPLVAKPGTQFNYNSVNTQLLSEMVAQATGQSLEDYAKEVLFQPIGIKRYFWKTAPEGFNDALGGLYLAPRDLARFALLYARGGEWNGRQVLPAAWAAQSTRAQVKDVNPEDPDDNRGYGYQWWIFSQGENGQPEMYGTWGWGGQFALVVPSLQLIAVFTGWNTYDDQEYDDAYKLFYDRIVVPAAATSGTNSP